jgi:hypothetical protein
MAREKSPAKSALPDDSLNAEPDLHRELINDNCTMTPSILITDDCHILNGYRNKSHSYIASSFLTDTEYPDPYLEVSFECAYHEQLPPPDALDEKHEETHDKKQDDQGYRSLHRACVKFTSANFAKLRVIRLEARTIEVSFIPSILFCWIQ